MTGTPLFPEARRLETCPACAGARLKPFRRSVDFHYQIPGEFDTERCQDCGLVMVSPMPSVSDLGRLYPDDYYSYQTPSLPKPWKRALKRLVGLHRETMVPRRERPGTMLDVGCGAGQYLIEMQARGWKVFGSELNKGGAAAGARAGLDIRSGELTQASFEPGSFDFVRLNHSFEHIPNPHSVLAEARRLLKPDGRLFIGVPNADGMMARLFGRYWWFAGLPVHTYGYTPLSLSKVLERNGFRVERLRYHSDYGGVIGSLQIFLNRHHEPRHSDGFLMRSLLLRLPAQYLARLLDLFRAGDCIEVLAVPDGVASLAAPPLAAAPAPAGPR
jgi:SAM-dependent methyltransferase